MADDESSGLVLRLIICLIAAASATVVVAVYHCITARCMRPPRRQSLSPPVMQQEMSMDNSVAELLPAHKYQKDVGLIGVDDGTCAICLSEFEDEEELRTLPECVHSFHVACIDMWLYSHSNCPMCRTFVVASGMSSPSLMHLLNPSNVQNTAPIDTL